MVKIYVLIISVLVIFVTIILIPVYAPGKVAYFGKGQQIQCDNVFGWLRLAKCANDKWAHIGKITVVCEGTTLYTKNVCNDWCGNQTQCNYDNTTIAYKIKSEFISEYQWKSIKYCNKVFIAMCSLLSVNVLIVITISIVLYIEYNRKEHMNNDLTEPLI